MSPVRPERWRIFLAVVLSDAVRAKLAGALQDLQPLASTVAATPIDRIHLTLHFLGEVDAVRVGKIALGLGPSVAARTRFPIEVAGVGAFPSIRRPNILWAGVVGDHLGDLLALHAAAGSALAAAGVPLELRPYVPHLTLGRVRRPLTARERVRMRDWGERWSSAVFGQVEVDEVSLIRSELALKPPRYTTVESFPLQ
jgi:2'-5' RNA ligase